MRKKLTKVKNYNWVKKNPISMKQLKYEFWVQESECKQILRLLCFCETFVELAKSAWAIQLQYLAVRSNKAVCPNNYVRFINDAWILHVNAGIVYLHSALKPRKFERKQWKKAHTHRIGKNCYSDRNNSNNGHNK